MTVPDRSGICAQVDTQTSAVGKAKRNEASIINPDLIRYILNCFELLNESNENTLINVIIC